MNFTDRELSIINSALSEAIDHYLDMRNADNDPKGRAWWNEKARAAKDLQLEVRRSLPPRSGFHLSI